MAYDGKKIYGASKLNVYQKCLAKIEKTGVSARNRELFFAFANSLFAKNVGDLRVSKLLTQLRKIVGWVQKDLDKVAKSDLRDLVAKINQKKEYTKTTQADYRRVLKQFYGWYKDEDPRVYSLDREQMLEAKAFYDFIEKNIKTSSKIEPIDPSLVLSEDDINTVVASTRSIKERALIKFLYETGVRAGELLNIKIKDIKINCVSANVLVDGKTGMRNVPITKSIQYLVSWLEVHPDRDNPESYLWVGDSPRYKRKPLMHRGCQKLLDRCFERAGVKKKHNLHWFRHSRATLLAPYLTEPLLCKYLGWVLGSNQVRRYVHLCNQQLDDAYLKMHGLKEEEEESDKPLKCGCGVVNDAASRYCYKCGRPLSVEVAIKDEENKKVEMDKTVQLLMEIAKNPELMARFEEFKKNF